MKYLIIYSFAFLVLLAGCSKETEPVFDQSADERLSAVLQANLAALTGAPNGWKAYVYPAGGGAYTFYFKFNNQNQVQMVSDFKPASAGTVQQSTYRLKAMQKPSLIFDTYSYVHVLADPVDTVNGGIRGEGLNSDFEFSFEKVSADSIILKGLAKGSDAILLKATAAEADSAFNKARLRTIVTATQNYTTDNPYLYIPGSNNVKISLVFGFSSRTMQFSFLSPNGSLVNTEVPFTYTINGIILKTPVTIGGYTFQELIWDAAKGVYYIMVGNNRIELGSASAPVIPFYQLLGSTYPFIYLDPSPPLPGQSPLFIQEYVKAQTAIKNGPYGLDLYFMAFVFDASTRTMTLMTPVTQGNSSPFAVDYYYNYVIDNNGIIKFTRTDMNGNATLIEGDMKSILDYVDNDHFKVDYFQNGPTLLGQMTSIEHPNFFFTGYLD